MEDLLAEWALGLLLSGPAGGEAVHAVVVSTGDGHRLGEDVQTDAALDLLCIQSGGHLVSLWVGKQGETLRRVHKLSYCLVYNSYCLQSTTSRPGIGRGTFICLQLLLL